MKHVPNRSYQQIFCYINSETQQRLFLAPDTASNILLARLRSVFMIFSALILAGRDVLNRLGSTFRDPFQLAYKQAVDTNVLLCHFVSKSLNGSSKSVRCVFLDFSASPFARILFSSITLNSLGARFFILPWLKVKFPIKPNEPNLVITSSPLFEHLW